MRLGVSRDGKQLAHRTVTRIRMADGVRHRELTVADDGVNGTLHLPPEGSDDAAPALLLGGSEGGNSQQGLAAFLASHGHPALALCYFRCEGRPETLEEIELEYFAKAARLLAGQEGVKARKLTVIGGSRGSEAAQLLGQYHPELVEDVVAVASSNQVGPAFPSTTEYAWTRNGEPVPEEEIPLDDVRGTVLGIAGGDDRLWSSEFLSRGIAEEHRLLVYPRAGHHVGGPPYLPVGRTISVHPVTGARMDLGGTRAANAAAGADSWPKVLKLLRS